MSIDDSCSFVFLVKTQENIPKELIIRIDYVLRSFLLLSSAYRFTLDEEEKRAARPGSPKE